MSRIDNAAKELAWLSESCPVCQRTFASHTLRDTHACLMNCDREDLVKAIITAVEGSVIERTHAKNEVLRDVLATIKETAERFDVKVSE